MKKFKIVYIVILFVLIFGAWGLKPIDQITGDKLLVLQFAYLLYGYIHFDNEEFSLFSPSMTLFWWVIAGMALSTIPANIYHSQSYLQSIITYRQQYLWFSIPVIMKIQPNRDELLSSIFIIAGLVIVLLPLRLILPSLFVFTEKEILDIYSGKFQIRGFQFVIIPVFYCLAKMREDYEIKHFIVILVCFAFLFVIQNRSTLLPVVLIIVYSLFGINSPNKPIFITIMLISLVYIAYVTSDTWVAIYEKSLSQLNSDNYNRVKAFQYYFSKASNPGILTYVLGNGFLSAHSSNTMEYLMEDGIYNSDMGVLGFWNQFGIIPVIVFLYMFINPIIHHKEYSYLLSCFGLFYLITSLTTAYFGLSSHLPLFVVYYYLYVCNNSIEESND